MFKQILIAAAAAAVAQAGVFAQHSAPLAQNGKQIGTIIIGTPYERRANAVAIEGWRPVGGQIIYERMGVLSEAVKLSANADVTVLSTREDEYENEWEQVRLIAQLDAGADGAADVIADGKELFAERCGTCHALHPVDEFSKNVWPQTVRSMQDSAGLDEDEYYQVVKYLQRVAPDDDE